MKLVPFIAENANAALVKIHEELGPDAVVVSVRKLPNGISRLWKHNQQVEVVAGIADSPKRKVHAVSKDEDTYVPFEEKIKIDLGNPTHHWQSIAWLETMGLLPVYAEELQQKARAVHGDIEPEMALEEWRIVHDLLAARWKPARQTMDGTGRPHVFIGSPGSGKTTVLCKWMTRAVLAEEQSARVWRLDGETANTSEFLSLQCELVGAPVERFWNDSFDSNDLLFVDLPGVEIHHAKALAELHEQIFKLPQPHIHLVLNAAYDCEILFEQIHAFAPFAPEDIIFTHLDEERRRVKLWNFVLGTNCSISFLSAGQKIPGEFNRADTALLFPHENRR